MSEDKTNCGDESCITKYGVKGQEKFCDTCKEKVNVFGEV